MEFLVRAIRTEEDYQAALDLLSSLMDAEPGTPEDEHLEIMIALVEAYENVHWRIDPPDPIDAIRVRMEEKGLRPRDLEPMIGSRGRVSEVLSRKRALTLPMIRRLAKGLDLPAEILIRETRISPPKPTPRPAKPRRPARRTQSP
jgi:HTH-type transcriptional regulator / antitoxin HigA